MMNNIVNKSGGLSVFDRFTIESEYDMKLFQNVNFVNLQMTFLSIISKAKKNFLNFKLICLASTIWKVKFQAINSFDIAFIETAYLNKYHLFVQAHSRIMAND